MRPLVLLLLSSLFACGDEETACTEMGCGLDTETARLTLSEPAGGWAAEQEVQYRIFLTYDGDTQTCAGTPASGLWCDGEDTSVENSDVGEGERVVALTAILLNAFPETLDLVIERDGVDVVTQGFEIEPAVSYPNGPSCAPECRTWSGTVDSW